MYPVAYYIVFAMRNESTMVNSKKYSDLVLLFDSAMHDPTIYISIVFACHALRVTCIDINMYIIYLRMAIVRSPNSSVGLSASIESER